MSDSKTKFIEELERRVSTKNINNIIYTKIKYDGIIKSLEGIDSDGKQHKKFELEIIGNFKQLKVKHVSNTFFKDPTLCCAQ